VRSPAALAFGLSRLVVLKSPVCVAHCDKGSLPTRNHPNKLALKESRSSGK